MITLYIYFCTDQLILWQQHSPTEVALNLHFVLTASPLVRLLQPNVCPSWLVSREAESGCLLVLLCCAGKSVCLHLNGLQWTSLFLTYTQLLQTCCLCIYKKNIVLPTVLQAWGDAESLGISACFANAVFQLLSYNLNEMSEAATHQKIVHIMLFN